jgi:hypothetical protein
MKKSIVFISGSPRKGNTNYILTKLVKAIGTKNSTGILQRIEGIAKRIERELIKILGKV